MVQVLLTLWWRAQTAGAEWIHFLSLECIKTFVVILCLPGYFAGGVRFGGGDEGREARVKYAVSCPAGYV